MSYSLTILDNRITTASGDIVSQIPSLAGYATESWVNGQNYIDINELTTTSGDIINQMPSLAGYATESWVNDQNYIDANELTTVSGDIVDQIPSLTGYATESWVGSQNYINSTNLATTSGDIVAQIPSITHDIVVSIDGGGSAIVSGTTVWSQVNYNCDIQSWTLLADQSGSIQLDIWKDSYANYPPDDSDSITASAPPTVSGVIKNTSSTLTGWTTTITSGDILKINVDSCTTIQRVALILTVLE